MARGTSGGIDRSLYG